MAQVQAQVTITITQPNPPLSLDVSGVPASGVVNTPYSGTAVASGGTPPYKYSNDGALPAGLTLDPNAGTLTGTPTAPIVDTFDIIVNDSAA